MSTTGRRSLGSLGSTTNVVGTIALCLFLFFVYRLYVSAGKNDRLSEKQKDYETLMEQRRPGPGCPVLFTDKSELAGARRCFQLGGIPDLMLKGTGLDPEEKDKDRQHRMVNSFYDGKVMSLSVRPGYHLTAYSEPDYGGKILFDRRGPVEKSYSDTFEDPVSAADICALRRSGIDPEDWANHRKPSDAIRPRSLRIGFG